MKPDSTTINEHQTARALEALSRVGLAEVWTYLKTPAQLSDGQRWRLRLAIAIARAAQTSGAQSTRMPPLILAADEFGALLDRITAMIVARALRKAVSTTPNLRAIVATCHDDLNEALAPDRIIHCDFGQYTTST